MWDLNFFSTLEKTKKSSARKRNAVILAFVAIFVVIAAAYAVSEYMAVAINKDILVTKDYLSSGDIGARKMVIDEKKQQLDIMKRYYSVVEASDAKVAGIFTLKSSFIDAIDRTVPAGVAYTSVTYTSSSFSAQCTAVSKALVAELYDKLYGLGYFDNVYIADISKTSGSPESYSFSVECSIRGGAVK